MNDATEFFKVNEPIDPMLFGEAFDPLALMLPDSGSERIGHANVQRAVPLAGENVDPERTRVRAGGHAAGFFAALRMTRCEMSAQQR